jgi:acetyl-CoA synthetase
MLPRATSWEALHAGFGWDLRLRLNMAAQALGGDPAALAIVGLTGPARRDITRGELAAMAGGLARALAARGVVRGDRVGVLMGQDAWCAAAHGAIWALGAISVPLFKLFGPEALATRIGDCGLAVAVTDAEGAAMLARFGLDLMIPHTAPPHPALLDPVVTGPEDPAVLIYTSGTTGAPKGALHGHRLLTGHLPGVELSHDLLGQPGDTLWTPADWAWIGGLFDVLMPGLALGVPVVAAPTRGFDPETCARVIRDGAVRNVFFPPTALRMLKAADARLPGLRSVASGGEPLGAEMRDWGREALGVTINEFYGQTECNMIVSSCAALYDTPPGAMGRAVPGHQVAVIDAAGRPTAGEGDIAVRRGSASMMLGYWQNPDATAGKYRGDWMLTGDRGAADGPVLRFVGRQDDVITSAGYRIGPAEIEDCLLAHPAVASAGVVGKPDRLRTEIVKAYVVAKPGMQAPDLPGQLQDHVRARLARHAYPREVEIVEALPMTVTGKVMRKALKARAAGED